MKGVPVGTEVPYTPPKLDVERFNCPLCHAFAHQEWCNPAIVVGSKNYGPAGHFKIARCAHCNNFSIWMYGSMAFPIVNGAPRPNPDLSPGVMADYLEASAILSKSPRGAAALLRLAIDKICGELEAEGNDPNAKIASLVRRGLPVMVQQSLDIVRVIGNEAVHPGQIDLRDDVETATQLFGLVNIVADVMISQPKHVKALYETLPPDKRQWIEERDKAKGPTRP
jgi:hypothetical protein